MTSFALYWITLLLCIITADIPFKSRSTQQTNIDDYDWDKMQSNEIKPVYKNPTKIYRKLNTKHSITANGKDWVHIPGLQQIVKVERDNTECQVTFHCHGAAHDSARRLDIKIFVDNNSCGIDGSNYNDDWKEPGGIGMALSRTPTWLPMISFCSMKLNQGNHVINVGIRNTAANGAVNVKGNGIMIHLYKPIVLDYMWKDIDINDNKMLFDKDAEYRVELFGKQWIYPISISDRKIVIMFLSDDDGLEMYVNGVIRAYDKRSVFTQESCMKSYVTKIQARKVQ